MSKIENIEYTKVTLNVPKRLLKEFDTIAYLTHYSRVEGIKEALRTFIDRNTPENYQDPEQVTNMWRGVMDAMLEISKDPKYQSLNQQQQQQVMQQQFDPSTLQSQAVQQLGEGAQQNWFERPTKEELRKNKKKPARK
tara:strand:- start:61 stop:474 length:414 start_codon:yes stop_codon:yes gene_type:complete